MKHYIFYKQSGEITGNCVLQDDVQPEPLGGATAMEVDGPIDGNLVKIVDGNIVPYSQEGAARKMKPPVVSCVWDAVSEDWVVTASNEELANWARQRRNELLVASDWTQLPDVPDATKASWALYRQQLRDITEQAGFPQNIQWPQPPQ